MTAEAKIVFPNTSALIAAEAPDFPSFLFSERELHKAVKVFKKGFDGLLTYAVKCNPSPHILDQLHREGLKAFDVASNVEMELVRRHCPGAAMHYNNPIKNKREIERAYDEFGIRSFTIDHPQQLDQLAAVVSPSRDIEVTIRFKAGKALKSYDFGIKFGVMQDGAAEIVSLVDQMGFTPSLCFHVGSQCEDAYAYERHIAAAAKIAEEGGIELKRLNIGGGYPAPYPTSEAPPMDVYFDTISAAVKDNFGKSAPELIIEPGRALVRSSSSICSAMSFPLTWYVPASTCAFNLATRSSRVSGAASTAAFAEARACACDESSTCAAGVATSLFCAGACAFPAIPVVRLTAPTWLARSDSLSEIFIVIAPFCPNVASLPIIVG